MQLSPAPIQAPLVAANGIVSTIWAKWFVFLVSKGNETALTLNATTAPTVDDGTAVVWLASSAGTKDGQAYSQGDLLITSKVGATSKTLLVLDWSAL